MLNILYHRLNKMARFLRQNSESILPLSVVVISILSYANLANHSVYIFGYSDQLVHIPIIYHFMHDGWLANDWLVQSKTIVAGPRFYYGHLMASISSLLGLHLGFFLVYSVSFVAIIIGMGRLAADLFESEWVGAIVVVLYFLPPTAVQGDVIQLGNFHFPYNLLIPNVIAEGLVLVALTCAYRCRYWIAFTLFAAATLIHIPVGGWMTLVAIVSITTMGLLESKGSAHTLSERLENLPWRPISFYFVTVGGLYMPLILRNLRSMGSFTEAYIIAWVRHPHHTVPSTWSHEMYIAYGSLFLVAGTTYLVCLRLGKRPFPTDRARVFGLTYISVLIAIMISGLVFTEIVPVPTVIKLYPFHISYFPHIILFGVMGVAVVQLSQTVSSMLNRPEITPSLLLLILIAPIVLNPLTSLSLDIGIHQRPTSSSPEAPLAIEKPHIANEGIVGSVSDRVVDYGFRGAEGDAYKWIRQNTNPDDRIITPPSLQTARLGTNRAIIVDKKAFVFTQGGPTEWERRMSLVCNREFLERKQCEYNQLSENTIELIALRYNSQYLLTTNTSYTFEVVYQNDKYHIYKISV